MTLLAAYGAALAVFVVLDAAWLVLVAGGLFQARLGAVLRPDPALAAAGALYVVYAFGLVVLAIRPVLARGAAAAAAHGAVLGLTAYATFDLTGLAIIAGWTLDLALVDMAWGTAVSAVAAAAGCAAARAASRSAAARRAR